MGFLVSCPNCGERNAYEFRFGGEVQKRPSPNVSAEEWTTYLYVRRNIAGEDREWFYHSFGCRKWFVGIRDRVTNEVSETAWSEEAPG